MKWTALFLLSVLAGCSGEGVIHENLPPQSSCPGWTTGMLFGTMQADELLDVVTDARGHVYLAGYEDGIIGKTNIEPAGNSRGVILEYDPCGQLVNRTIIDTPEADSVEAVSLDPLTGELLLAGRTNNALPGFLNHGQFDLIVGRIIKENGQPVLTQFGTERPEHPRRIESTSNNSVFVAGYFDIYVPTNYVESWEDPLLTKFAVEDQNIEEVWRAPLDTDEQDVVSAVAATDETVYVAGFRFGGADAGIFLSAFDSQGTLIWSRRLTHIGYDSAAALAVTRDGNLLLAGSTFSWLGERAYGQSDAVVITVDSGTGEMNRVIRYGSSETDWVTDMTVDSHGNIYLVGETLGAFDEARPNNGSGDIFLMKFDAEGTLLMVRQWGTEALDSPTAVAVDPSGNIFVTGYSDGPLFGSSHGSRDGFLIVVSSEEAGNGGWYERQ